MTRGSAEIGRRLDAEHAAIELLDTIPGISARSAEILIAEIGTELTRFPPPNTWRRGLGAVQAKKSGGKRLSRKTRHGNPTLRQVLIEITHVASKTKDTYLAAQYRRIAARPREETRSRRPGIRSW